MAETDYIDVPVPIGPTVFPTYFSAGPSRSNGNWMERDYRFNNPVASAVNAIISAAAARQPSAPPMDHDETITASGTSS